MYPEADFMDIKVLMHMANPKALAPKAKPDLKVQSQNVLRAAGQEKCPRKRWAGGITTAG